jgi:hypothetical protein
LKCTITIVHCSRGEYIANMAENGYHLTRVEKVCDQEHILGTVFLEGREMVVEDSTCLRLEMIYGVSCRSKRQVSY